MFPFKADYSYRQKNVSNGTNRCRYIVLHHTATGYGTINGNIKTLLGETPRKVSCHFIVDTNGDAYKLAQPNKITWHAGESSWNGLKGMNKYSLGIEVVGPLPNFTKEQKSTVFWLVQHLMAVFKIPKENVITHKMIAPGRKTDIHDSFFEPDYKTWISKLKPREYV